VEPKDRKRKSKDKGSNDDEQEIDEEEVPLVQHPTQGGQPAQGIHFGVI